MQCRPRYGLALRLARETSVTRRLHYFFSRVPASSCGSYARLLRTPTSTRREHHLDTRLTPGHGSTPHVRSRPVPRHTATHANRASEAGAFTHPLASTLPRAPLFVLRLLSGTAGKSLLHVRAGTGSSFFVSRAWQIQCCTAWSAGVPPPRWAEANTSRGRTVETPKGHPPHRHIQCSEHPHRTLSLRTAGRTGSWCACSGLHAQTLLP